MIVLRSVPPSAVKPQISSLAVVVDDDEQVRESVVNLLQSVGQAVAAFASPAGYFGAKLPEVPSCLLLDVRLQGENGFDVQTELARNGVRTPIIFMTGHGDIAMGVRAMKAGAIDFLTKPFRDQDLLDVVAQAIERDRRSRAAEEAQADMRRRYASLTPREREVMAHVVRGLLNKQIAGEMELQEITVKIHRGNMMRKMGVRPVADLVRIAERLGLYRDD